MDAETINVGIRIKSRFHEIEPDKTESLCYFAEMMESVMEGDDSEESEEVRRFLKFLFDDDGECDNFEMYTEGELYYGDGKLEVRYREPEITGMGDSVTSISFDCGDRSLVTITRGGDVYTALVLERGVRHTCAYNTSSQPFIVYTTARRIENSLDRRGGTLDMIYTVETGMSPPQFNRMTMTVTPVPRSEALPI